MEKATEDIWIPHEAGYGRRRVARKGQKLTPVMKRAIEAAKPAEPKAKTKPKTKAARPVEDKSAKE